MLDTVLPSSALRRREHFTPPPQQWLAPGTLEKNDRRAPLFAKVSATALVVNGGWVATKKGDVGRVAPGKVVAMPALVPGLDYAIYLCDDWTWRADASFVAPAGYSVNNSRLIGGFHVGHIAPGTTPAGGGFATSGSGHIWTQADVDDLAGIDKYSIWDLHYRSASDDLRAQRGFVRTPGGIWVGKYLVGPNTDVDGLSKYNSQIASGTVLPRKPAAFGGDGAATYPNCDWWTASEICRAYGARLLTEDEFAAAAYGVTEGQSIGGAASTYPNTQRNPGYTSRWGVEQATGHQWIWGRDAGTRWDAPGGWAWRAVTGGRGGLYIQGDYSLTRVLLGGDRSSGANSGSRCSAWGDYPWVSGWGFGLRAACDHLQLG